MIALIYPNTAVGNSAVQQAHTGMAFYDCDLAVVVTNSTFTPKAVEVAQKVGCVLIDGDGIPRLLDRESIF